MFFTSQYLRFPSRSSKAFCGEKAFCIQDPTVFGKGACPPAALPVTPRILWLQTSRQLQYCFFCPIPMHGVARMSNRPWFLQEMRRGCAIACAPIKFDQGQVRVTRFPRRPRCQEPVPDCRVLSPVHQSICKTAGRCIAGVPDKPYGATHS